MPSELMSFCAFPAKGGRRGVGLEADDHFGADFVAGACGHDCIVVIEVFLVVEAEIAVDSLVGVGECAADSDAVARWVGRGELAILIADAVAVVGHAVEAGLHGGLVKHSSLDREGIVGKEVIAVG